MMIWIILALLLFSFLSGLLVLVYAETHPAPVSDRSAAIVVLGAQVYADGQLSQLHKINWKEFSPFFWKRLCKTGVNSLFGIMPFGIIL